MHATTLLERCYGAQKPDGICLGYMEAALDFMTEYQLWLTMNRYDLPPDDRVLCVTNDTSPYRAAAVFVAWMQRHNDVRAANAAVGDAISEAFACTK
jgi:Rap1a immunity proteins